MTDRDAKIIEYQEVQADRRHYDVLRWTVVGLTYPTGFAAIAFAADRWGFMSGRAFLVGVVGSLWLIAGSLVFAQIHFYGQVRMNRARELEEQLGFQNVSNKQFLRLSENPQRQPWHARDLAWWFHVAVPLAVTASTLFWGGLVWCNCLPSAAAERDRYAAVAGVVLFGTAMVVFVARAVREPKRDAKKQRLNE